MRQKQYIIKQCVTCKKEIKEIQTISVSSVLHGGGEKSATLLFPSWNEGVLSTITTYPISKEKDLGCRNEEMGWAQSTSLLVTNCVQNYYWIYIIGVESIFLFEFYCFCVYVLRFFFNPSQNSFKIKILCQLWTRGKGKGVNYF